MASAVADSSPLILLANAGLENLLRIAGDPVFVPVAVAQEIQKRGPLDPTAIFLSSKKWIVQVDPGPMPKSLQTLNLGVGETSVLTWALAHAGTTALLDDLPARRCATALGIPVRGTLGMVLIAKQRGVIPLAKPILEQLIQSGMYLSPCVLTRALARVGE